MQHSLPNLSADKRYQLDQLVHEVRKSFALELVLCFGARVQSSHLWSCFNHDVNSFEFIQYDLLVIVADKEGASRHAVACAFQNASHSSFKVTALVHSIDDVNDALLERDFFFTQCLSEGLTIYRANNFIFFHELPSVVLAELSVEIMWKHHFELALELVDEASLLILEARRVEAIVALHHATVNICHALIGIYTGYKPACNSINELFELVNNFSDDLQCIFPGLTQDDIESFMLLSSVNDFCESDLEPKISRAMIDRLQNKVIHALHVAEQLYSKKLKSFSHEKS